ncbi:RagB/SusD family nutrient uptake outer membrane protein [Pedobacter changchengzhani]|nr:RagB/SusD family nutrient uptake outer membrane protein [Pedobacter changchengzhani]
MKRLLIILTLVLPFVFSGCKKALDNRIDTSLTPDQVFVNYDRIKSFGLGTYAYLPAGYNRVGGAFLAGATDDAEETNTSSAIQAFNFGSWTAFSNPEVTFGSFYNGIRNANLFLERTTNFKQIIARDTFTVEGRQKYIRNVDDLRWLRQEVRFIRSYIYFELIKRYGGVPLVTKSLQLDEGKDIPRSSYNDMVTFISNECDAVKDSVRDEWLGYSDTETGRITKGTVLALKSRLLLYAASPLNNPGNDAQKWQAAAKAAQDVIAMNKYSLFNNYQNLFLTPNSYRSTEVILSRRYSGSNGPERANFPIGTPGGQSGTTPSQNLVDSYEKLAGWDATNPYNLRDPRLNATVVVNNSNWNGRTIQTYIGGADGPGKERTSKTGYYLKKFLSNPLDLVNNQTTVKAWILFRYGEILLNYAEAMNEAYGPDDANGYGLTARQAINSLRARPGVNMPAVVAIGQGDLREKIKNERRVELAYEDHRFWDVKRWKIAESTLGAPLLGIEITKDANGVFSYVTKEVEKRVFQQKMYLYPIPQIEVNKSNGVIVQNPGW